MNDGKMHIDLFLEECNKCYRCFVEYCKDNAEEQGGVTNETFYKAVLDFIDNLEIGYKKFVEMRTSK